MSVLSVARVVEDALDAEVSVAVSLAAEESLLPLVDKLAPSVMIEPSLEVFKLESEVLSDS